MLKTRVAALVAFSLIALSFSGCDEPVIEANHEIPSGYENQGTIYVNNTNLTICLRDHATVDGDRIDLVVNGQYMLTNYEVTGDEDCYTITLPVGNNWIGVIALDEGALSPCTPGVTIDDGYNRQDFEIRSYVGGSNGAYVINVDL